MSILSFKFRKIKSDFPIRKRLKKFLTKNVSPPHRNLVFFPKKWYQKTSISAANTWEIHKVQKCHQKASRSLQSRVINNLIFSQHLANRKFKSDSPRENEKCVSASQKLCDFPKKCTEKWKNNYFGYKNMKNTSPKIPSKGLKEPSIKSYKQFKFIQKSEI